MANRAIELHESEVVEVLKRGADTVVRVSFNVHESDGDPGAARGTLWEQEGLIVLEDAVVAETPERSYLQVADGSIVVAGRRFANLLPLPFDHEGSAAVEFSGAGGALRAACRRLRVMMTGTPVFVEDFPGR